MWVDCDVLGDVRVKSRDIGGLVGHVRLGKRHGTFTRHSDGDHGITTLPLDRSRSNTSAGSRFSTVSYPVVLPHPMVPITPWYVIYLLLLLLPELPELPDDEELEPELYELPLGEV